jgi:16S rRNA (cytosine1402-N4)-methyltransferase
VSEAQPAAAPASPFVHETVLLEETVAALAPRSGGLYVDATVGGGGHTERLLALSSPDGRVVGLDRDERALAAARDRLAAYGARLELVHARFGELRAVLEERGVTRVDGVIADLGVSSPQLDDATRGFSFTRGGPLDMRMDGSSGETAAECIARLDESELADILFKYGEERRSRPIARSIKRAEAEGQLRTTDDLRRAVVRVLGPRKQGSSDPATRTFQALRIAVNDELGELESLLATLPELLADGGVASLISFHSLEDRLIKHAFRDDARLEPLTKRPVVAGDDESARNPRARSAKLRAARRRARADERAHGGAP